MVHPEIVNFELGILRTQAVALKEAADVAEAAAKSLIDSKYNDLEQIPDDLIRTAFKISEEASKNAKRAHGKLIKFQRELK